MKIELKKFKLHVYKSSWILHLFFASNNQQSEFAHSQREEVQQKVVWGCLVEKFKIEDLWGWNKSKALSLFTFLLKQLHNMHHILFEGTEREKSFYCLFACLNWNFCTWFIPHRFARRKQFKTFHARVSFVLIFS